MRQRAFSCGLMIYKAFRLDDIHAFGVMWRVCAETAEAVEAWFESVADREHLSTVYSF
jgi:hypothetical protein